MKKQYAWKVTRKYRNGISSSHAGITTSGKTVFYKVGEFTKSPNDWGLFIFKRREDAREFKKDRALISSDSFCVWKCEIGEILNNPTQSETWFHGTMWTNRVKLLHKA